MPPERDSNTPLLLLTGATGYVGARLLPLLEQQPIQLRCLARKPEVLQPRVNAATKIAAGDVLDAHSLQQALEGVHTAYYLVHLMSTSADFQKDDRQAAINFGQAARKSGVRRIIYLGND